MQHVARETPRKEVARIESRCCGNRGLLAAIGYGLPGSHKDIIKVIYLNVVTDCPGRVASFNRASDGVTSQVSNHGGYRQGVAGEDGDSLGQIIGGKEIVARKKAAGETVHFAELGQVASSGLFLVQVFPGGNNRQGRRWMTIHADSSIADR